MTAEHPQPGEGIPIPERLHVLKDELMERFGQLPPEHQATMALVLVNQVIEGELGEWMREAIALRFPQDNPFAVSHDDLRQTRLPDGQISQLNDQDLAHISRMLRQHYEQDVFLVAAPVIAELVLAEKQKPPKPVLLDQATRDKLPPLYAGEEQNLGLNALAQVKYFLPSTGWTWYPSEGSPVDEDGFYDTDKPKVDYVFFGLVSGLEVELGYFSLSELEDLRSPFGGLPVERDLYFEPKTLRELQELHKRGTTGD
jgi:hypothetical protein